MEKRSLMIIFRVSTKLALFPKVMKTVSSLIPIKNVNYVLIEYLKCSFSLNELIIGQNRYCNEFEYRLANSKVIKIQNTNQQVKKINKSALHLCSSIVRANKINNLIAANNLHCKSIDLHTPNFLSHIILQLHNSSMFDIGLN
jgi:hypothetical protein